MNRRKRGRGPAANRVPPKVVAVISNPEPDWEERIRVVYEILHKSAMKSGDLTVSGTAKREEIT